ncbi:MAG: putative baseplate assembly protein [Kineosporiaceae bacterium]
MSRPPRPQPRVRTAAPEPGTGAMDYLSVTFDDLLALQAALAATELGRPPGGRARHRGTGTDDPAETFRQLAALVGHVLADYQRRYAREAYLGTALAPSSLIRHARRLGSRPDPGVAASGHVALTVKPGLSGTVEAGLALSSVARGTAKAQDYETGTALEVDSALNAMVPAQATRPVGTRPAGTASVRVARTGLGLRSGDRALLLHTAGSRFEGIGVTVRTCVEDAAAGVSVLTVDPPLPRPLPPGGRLLARPAALASSFAADADPVAYPRDRVRQATPVSSGNPTLRYEVSRTDGGGHDSRDVYLDRRLETPLGEYVWRAGGDGGSVLRVTGQAVATVSLLRQETRSVNVPSVQVTENPQGAFTVQTSGQTTVTTTVDTHVSGTVTALRLQAMRGSTVETARRPDFVLESRWYGAWEVEADLAAEEPNPAPLTPPLRLPGVLPQLVPGRPLVFTDPDRTRAQVVSVTRATPDEAANGTAIHWEALTPPPEPGWTLDQLVVLGNVAGVSHGRTASERLGTSDGTTPYQRFALRRRPVTVLLGPAGGEPEIEVRIDGVRWDLVTDFAGSGPTDRHYRLLSDEEQAAQVVFGGGGFGAVPPPTAIEATYRVGLGTPGNVGPGLLSRLRTAHPLLDAVVNLTPVGAGAEPAGPDEIRAQATRGIRTFDRAVSVTDLADLALTMPGVARAGARWDDATSTALVVVATAEGESPPRDTVRAFLDARRDTSVRLRVDQPRPRAVTLVVDIVADPAWLPETVKAAVREALTGTDPRAPGLFTFAARELGQPAFLSEVYAVLESVAGVVSADVTGFAAVPGDAGRPADVVTAGIQEWLSLSGQDLTVFASGIGSGS